MAKIARKLFVAVTVILAALAVLFVASRPVAAVAQSAPADSEILSKGDPEAAIKQLRELWLALKSQDFKQDINTRILDLLSLADEHMATKRSYRDANTASVALPQAKEYGDVVFFTDLYVDPRAKHGPGDATTHSPAGFFIVGWKDGRIEKVAIEDVRMLSLGRKQIYCFPGMPQYRDDLPKHLYVEAAERSRRA